MIASSIENLPEFLAYFLSGLTLLILFAYAYSKITPHNEMQLIREGNTAAAIGFGGALLGYTLPLASAIAHSVAFIDMLIWGGIGFLVQIAVLGAIRVSIPGLFRDMESAKVAPAVLLALISISVGIINAAAMTY